MLNTLNINLKTDKTIKRALTTELMIKSHDINVIEFHISFDGLELTSEHTVKVLSVFDDSKSQTNVNCDIVDGKAIYRPDTSMISQYEHVLNYVYVYHGEQSLDVRLFTYRVDLSEIDKTALKVKTVYDQSYADLLAAFEQVLEDYKDSLPQASELRVEIDEVLGKFKADSRAKLDVIESAEEIRQTSENSRQEAEAERVENANRLQAETEETIGEMIFSGESEIQQAKRDAEESALKAQQAMEDYLNMLGVDVATLGPDGKLTADQIPALAINDTFTVKVKEEITNLIAQRGDVAILIHDENVSDAFILTEDEPSILDNWIKLGVSYVAEAGHAETATNAVNSQRINGHRVVAMSQEQYDLGAKDPETVYLVGGS